jgi:uncharacterized protein (TIGR02266 family)
MQILIARFRTCEEFLDRYQPAFEHGGLFHPTRDALPLGEPIIVDVRLPTLRDRLLVRGVIAWRRPGRRRTGVRAGVGIEFLPVEAPKRAFLLSLARGEEPGERGKRRYRRLPTELQVDWRVPQTPNRHLSVLEDIGPGGAFIRTREQPAPGTPVVLEVVPPGASAPLAIEGRVAWARETPGAEGVGVEFRCRDAGGLRRLKELVRRIERAEAKPAA